MNVSKFLLAIVLMAATTVPVSQAGNQDTQNQAPQYYSGPRVGSVGLQERGPSFSSPQETMHENGDRVGHYPPYYHPEGGGNGQR